MIATPNDAEIIIDIDTNAQKLDKKLKRILDQYSKKKIELDLELKNQFLLKRELMSLDNFIQEMGSKADKINYENFNKLSNSLSESIQKSKLLQNELKHLNLELNNEMLGGKFKLNTSPILKEFLNIGSSLKNIFGIIFSDFSSGISNAFLSTLNGLGNAIAQKLPNTIDLFQTMFSIASNRTSASIYYYVSLIKNSFNSAFEWIREKSSNLFTPISNAASRLKDNLSPAFEWIREKTSNLFAPISNAASKLKDSISNSFNWIRQEISKISPEVNQIYSSFKNIGSLIAQNFTNAAHSISSSFENIKKSANNASYHVDYFSRRIFNLLRNAFVFNVISRQFRGLSALIGNLINRDTIFVRTLTMVKANLIRAFAPIWQAVLPWIRLLGEGLLWLSKLLINFINWLTGSKIKPVETFKEAKSVVGDFYKIASPKKEMFNLVDPVKKIKNIKDGTKNVSKNTSKAGNNAKKLSKGLKKSAKESENILASFDKLEVLKFDKNKLSKDPFGLDELKNKLIDGPSNSNIPADFEVNVPSIEDQIADAINNIEDKPLDFYVNDDIGDQIISQVNGLTLPTLEFKVDENVQSWVNKFKENIINFYNWIEPLISSIGNFLVSLGDAFKRFFNKISENPAFKWISEQFTFVKDKIAEFFNTISKNENVMDALVNAIVAIGTAFVTYKIIKSFQGLISAISLLAQGAIAAVTSPAGWVALTIGALVLIVTHWEDIKRVTGEAWEKIKDFGNYIKTGFSDCFNAVKEKIEGVFEGIKNFALNTWKWIDDHVISPIKNAFGFGGGGFNFNAPSNLPNIPHLAQGSVLKGGDPFLAYLNDQPSGQTNVEAPLSTIVDAFRQAMSEGSFGQSNINIEASGDMSSIVRLLNFKIKDENNRIGNAFVNDIHI